MLYGEVIMNKSNFILCIIALCVAVFIAVATLGSFFIPSEPVSVSELPYRYEAENLRCMEDGVYGVKISTLLGVNDRTIPIKGDEIEINRFVSSESDSDIFVRDKGGDGEWRISTLFVNGTRELDITWESGNILIGESVILPTGERVTLLGFDFKGNPLFSVFEQ